MTDFTFDKHDVLHGVQVLDAAFAVLVYDYFGESAVQSALKNLTDPPTEACAHALIRIAARPLQLDRLGKVRADLENQGDSGLPEIKNVDPGEVELWARLVDVVTRPAAVARLSDLLFLRKYGRVGDYARRAVHAYLQAVGNEEDSLETTTYLVRAWTLSRLIGDRELEGKALDTIQIRVEGLRDGKGTTIPGVFHPLIEVLLEKPKDKSRIPPLRAYSRQLLENLASRYSRDDLVLWVATMRRKLLGSAGTPADLAAVAHDEVAGLVRDADASTSPAVLLHRLEAAARIATERGLTAEARTITARMQAIPAEELGLQTVSTTAEVPRLDVEAYLSSFTRGADWRPGLEYFITQEAPPSGPVAGLRDYAAQTAQESAFRRLFSTTILGEGGLPRATLTEESEKDRHEMAFMGRTLAENHSRLWVEGLRRMAAKYGTPTIEELTSVIVRLGAGDPRLARSLAKGMIHFWSGDNESAVAVVMPKIEAAARRLLIELDEGIYRVQKDQGQGEFPGLYGLLTELERLAFDEDWAWFLRWLLLGPIGVNMRNDVAHGAVIDPVPEYAALVLRAGALLIMASPVADDLGKRVILQPDTRIPLSGLRRYADQALLKVSNRLMAWNFGILARRQRLRGSR
ncbi:hypothetical protein [Kineosporia sp. NBRC 101731]|uniref:DUF7380 domain-containing protein n=1 Tax=Kineosporia sp. NBRC 101731 TaxID=3032199 RepID=UPI0024A5F1A4|nr:hypothetical protein [Kineosporia sp. NBRC 101731]GLY30439.1 hypothetical protein Kisp02_38040 [Kineosporia sp. NBRC 101731]